MRRRRVDQVTVETDHEAQTGGSIAVPVQRRGLPTRFMLTPPHDVTMTRP